MDIVPAILVDGLIYASWLFIVALGLTLVFGVLKVVNIAHGGFYSLGAYAAATLSGLALAWGAPVWMTLPALFLAGAAVAAALGPLVERLALRPFAGRDEVVLLLVTYALFLIIEDGTKLIWGVNAYYVSDAYMLFGNVELGPLYYVGYDFFLMAVAVLCGLGVWYGLKRTTWGKVVLAVMFDEEMAAGMGVNIRRVHVAAFTFGIFLAALGGALTAPMVSVQPGLGVGVVILSFAVVVIGGLGSLEGAAIGALVVGLSRAAAVHLMPSAELFSIYLAMTVVLVLRPEGLFASHIARKI